MDTPVLTPRPSYIVTLHTPVAPRHPPPRPWDTLSYKPPCPGVREKQLLALLAPPPPQEEVQQQLSLNQLLDLLTPPQAYLLLNLPAPPPPKEEEHKHDLLASSQEEQLFALPPISSLEQSPTLELPVTLAMRLPSSFLPPQQWNPPASFLPSRQWRPPC